MTSTSPSTTAQIAENLNLLADHIENNVPQDQLDMTDFRQRRNEAGKLRSANFLGHHDCGSVGCAVGHAPFVDAPQFKPVASEFHDGSEGLDLNWGTYSTRLFGSNGFGNADTWVRCFQGNLSSDKASVMRRLRLRALELELFVAPAQ